MSDPILRQGANQILIYCDGACSGNPGPGGWGSIISFPDGHVRELGGGHNRTTNNQMELTAASEGLLALGDRQADVVVYTDSVYVIKGITQWVWGWMKNGWRTSEGKEVLNKEFWQKLMTAVGNRRAFGSISWQYTRGHVGIAGNERCDEIAVAYSKATGVRLYQGPRHSYSFEIEVLPPFEGLPERSNSKTAGAKKAAHSYLSLLGGTPMRHATWADCERRVKGQPGAKYKKSTSADDEVTILRSWSVDPKSLKS